MSTTADAKLIQYLTEAHGKEKELEVALEAHIGMATRDAYKKRLKAHLKETKSHARQVEQRLRKLGGADRIAKTVGDRLSQGVAMAKGPLHAARGTSAEEKELKNAKTEYSEEHEEIATYTAIETLATELGDKETAKVARQIRREEERMASFLEKQIPLLTKAVIKAEIPSSDRTSSVASANGSRRSSSSRSTAKKSAAKKKSSGSKRSTTSRSRSGSKSTSRRRSTASSRS